MDEEKREAKKDLTEKLRKNPWILSTFVLVILAVILLLGDLGVLSFTGNSISENEAGNILVNLYQSQGITGLSVDSVEEISGVYKVNMIYQGEIVPIYITKDGKYAGSLSSLDDTGANSAASETVNLAVFSDSSVYPSLGNENADITVVEFADFQCPWCAIAAGLSTWAKDTAKTNTQVASVLDSAGKVEAMAKQGKLRFIYVPMSFLGQESVYAAEAALCADKQGKFWEMHDAIFAAHDGEENNGKYSKDKLEVIAKKISGLDQNAFKNCLENDDTLSAVQEIALTAKNAGVTGTPTFYVNGKQVSASWAEIEAAIA